MLALCRVGGSGGIFSRKKTLGVGVGGGGGGGGGEGGELECSYQGHNTAESAIF